MSCDSCHPLTPPAARPSREAGFTLIEALIAIVILAVGLIAITNLFFVAAASNSLGNATTTTAALASERLDRLKAIPFNDLLAMCAAVPAGDPCGDLDGDPTTLPTFSDVQDIPGAPQILTEWQLIATGGNTYFIHVLAAPQVGLTGRRSRAEFTTFRTCGLAAKNQACTVNGDCCSASCGAGIAGVCD